MKGTARTSRGVGGETRPPTQPPLRPTSVIPLDLPAHLDTPSPPYREKCNRQKERRCQDGSCIPRIDLCPEEQLINQNTILIMIVVGIAVVIFVVILYCLQQRRRYRRNTQNPENVSGCDEGDNVSLYQPPPSYEEVISTNLYPPTPSMIRLRMENVGQLSEDVPITPPPNYDTALFILSRSQELAPSKSLAATRLPRRSISLSEVPSRESSQTPPSSPLENDVFTNNNHPVIIPPPPPSPLRHKQSDGSV